MSFTSLNRNNLLTIHHVLNSLESKGWINVSKTRRKIMVKICLELITVGVGVKWYYNSWILLCQGAVVCYSREL